MSLTPDTSKTDLTLQTERMILRPLRMSDAPTMADNLNNFEVSQWLATVAHPYGVNDAEWFVENGDALFRFGLEHRETGNLIGSCSLHGELGYWLDPRYWRQGLMKEVCQALISYYFEQGHAELTSGYFVGNERSASVLYHFGFANKGIEHKHCLARNGYFANQSLLLTKATWQSRVSG